MVSIELIGTLFKSEEEEKSQSIDIHRHNDCLYNRNCPLVPIRIIIRIPEHSEWLVDAEQSTGIPIT